MKSVLVLAFVTWVESAVPGVNASTMTPFTGHGVGLGTTVVLSIRAMVLQKHHDDIGWRDLVGGEYL